MAVAGMELILIIGNDWSPAEAQRILPWLLIFAYAGAGYLAIRTKKHFAELPESKLCPKCEKMFRTPNGNWLCMDC